MKTAILASTIARSVPLGSCAVQGAERQEQERRRRQIHPPLGAHLGQHRHDARGRCEQEKPRQSPPAAVGLLTERCAREWARRSQSGVTGAASSSVTETTVPLRTGAIRETGYSPP